MGKKIFEVYLAKEDVPNNEATSSGSGWYFLGAQAVKCRPILAQPTIRLLPML